MYTGDLSLDLLLRILVASAERRNFTNRGLGRLFLGLNLPSQKESLMACRSIEASISDSDVANLSRSCF